MSWDDSTYISTDTFVQYDGENVGMLENYTELKRKNVENSYGEKKTKWGMRQVCKMLPAADNSFSNEEYTYAPWINYDTQQVQNWKRTDLTSLDNIDYSPASDTESSISTTYSISFPPSLTVSANTDHPKVGRDITYTANEKVEGDYYYSDITSSYDGIDKNCKFGQVTGWITDRPSSGDNIAPTYFFGKFVGDGGRGASDSIFHFFNFSDF